MMMTMKRKKKGRPSLIEIQKRNLLKQQQEALIPISSPTSSSNDDADNPEAPVKKRNTNAVFDRSGDDLVTDQGGKVVKVTDTLHGAQMGCEPTTPLPDKKLLVFILDRLQKKDTHGVFSEPVDTSELPDYLEIIEKPMDFGTLRQKLDVGLYLNLEELEADVFLICSNAMEYNSSGTVYFRQARSIQDLAKRDFENLRHEGDDGELQPKVVRRGRPPGKQQKKPIGSSSADRVIPELSSGATLGTGEENTIGSNAYNLRKAPMMSKFLEADVALTTNRSRSGENYSEWLADWNDEFPASILRADMKYGKKHFSIDETRRHTYQQFHPSAFAHEPSLLSNLGGDTKQLMPVGLPFEHSYAQSVARFAANLGPVAWKVASKKLESVLPPGLNFGPGFVGENEASVQGPFFTFEEHNLASDGNPHRQMTASTAGVSPKVVARFQGKDSMTEVDKKLNSQELLVESSPPFSGTGPGLTFHNQQKFGSRPDTNGFDDASRDNIPSRMGLDGKHVLNGQSSPGDALLHPQTMALVPRCDSTSTHLVFGNIIDSENPDYSDSLKTLHSGNPMAPYTGTDLHDIPEAGGSGRQSWQASFPHPRPYSLQVQPDLDVRLQGQGSPSSRLRLGSPQQPDLVLQL